VKPARFSVQHLWMLAVLVLTSNLSWPGVRGQSCQPSAAKQQSAPQDSKQLTVAPAGTAKLEDVEQRLGPFQLGPINTHGQDFTVVLHSKRLPGAKPSTTDSGALASLEILDSAGRIQHQETFGYSVEGETFNDSCSASAEVLKGSMIAALLITSGCEPSAPEGGATWEIFGVWNGKFQRLGKPFTTEGGMAGFSAGEVTKRGTATLFQSDVIRLQVWTGNFHVIIPLTFNWMQGQLMPPRCLVQSGHGAVEGGCELPVEAERVPTGQGLTFVRMFAEANEGMGIAQHVVVKNDSKVEILVAKAIVVLNEGKDVIDIGIGDDPWLKLRIDGQEGWIRTQEDFLAIGLPPAG